MTLETRSFEIREVKAETREAVGLAVPYGQEYDNGDYRESFEAGAVDGMVGLPVFYGHDHLSRGMPVGRVVEERDLDEGHEVRVAFSDTEKGREVHTLMRDEVIRNFSIGFIPAEHRIDDSGERPLVVRTRVTPKEVSVTPLPAYAGALVSEVREAAHNPQKEDVVTDTQPNADLVELRDTVADLERKLAVVGTQTEAPAVPQFRDGGSLLKALAAGDETARAEFRAADQTPPATSDQAGATTGRTSWIDRPLRLVQENRQVMDLFAKAPLPAFGNVVEFPTVSSTSGTVGVQAAEGDSLPYMEIELATGTANVVTYGGYSRLSRQAIERGDAAYLNKVLEYQALQYAKATEAAFRATLAGVSGAGAATLAGGLAGADAQDWIDFVLDATGSIEDDSLGLTADFLLVSRDVFKAVSRLVDTTGRPIFALNGDGSNTVGEANLVRASANIGGLPVVVGPRLAANTAVVASKDAITTLESAGAPFRLQDEDIVRLTKDFSLYGYMATTVNDAKGLVVGDVDGI